MYYDLWNHCGTLVCEGLKVPGSNLVKGLKYVKLEIMQDLGDS